MLFGVVQTVRYKSVAPIGSTESPLMTYEQWNDLWSQSRLICGECGVQYVEHYPVRNCSRGRELRRLFRRLSL